MKRYRKVSLSILDRASLQFLMGSKMSGGRTVTKAPQNVTRIPYADLCSGVTSEWQTQVLQLHCDFINQNSKQKQSLPAKCLHLKWVIATNCHCKINKSSIFPGNIFVLIQMNVLCLRVNNYAYKSQSCSNLLKTWVCCCCCCLINSAWNVIIILIFVVIS